MTITGNNHTPKALLVTMADLAREFENETNLWFDYDNIPEQLSCEGILAARRFQLSNVEPIGWTPSQRWTKYLHFYDLASLDVLTSPAYALQHEMNEGRGSVWRQLQEKRQAAELHRSMLRSLTTVWLQRADSWGGRRPIDLPEPHVFLVHLRHDLGALDDGVNDFIDNRLVPELLMIAGFLGCERYVAVDAPTGPSAGPSQFYPPKSMDVYGVTTPEVLVSGTYRRYLSSLKLGPELEAALVPTGCGVYVQRPSPWRVSVRESLS